MTKVLVTGATGFIGKNLVENLSSNGYEVYAMALANEKSNIEHLMKIENVHVITDSIDQMISKVSEYENFKYCFHLASYGVNYAHQELDEMINVNVKMLMKVINFCKLNETALLINTGSCFEYGAISKKPIKEDEECKPEALYAATKNAAQIIGKVYAAMNNVPMITVRPFNVFGIYEGENRLLPQVFKAGLTKNNLKMTKGEQIRDYLYVKDLVELIRRLVESNNYTLYEIYNICSGNEIKIVDFVNKAIKICGFEKEIYNFGALDYRENESMYFVGDNSKIKKIISFENLNGLEKGIKEMYEWYLEMTRQE